MKTAVVRNRMPGGVGGQRREPLPTRLTPGETRGTLCVRLSNHGVVEFKVEMLLNSIQPLCGW